MTRFVWMLVVVVLSVMVGCGLGYTLWFPSQIDLNDAKEWTPVRTFDGTLNPADGIVHVEVYVVDSLVDGPISDPTYQNIIELTTSMGTARFRWASSKDFAAGWCEIADLDGDGWAEFVFLRGGVARVVAYRDAVFTFRARQDELLASHRVRLLDVNADRHPEFLLDGPLLLASPKPGTQRDGRVPVWRWEKDRGFAKVSDDLPANFQPGGPGAIVK